MVSMARKRTFTEQLRHLIATSGQTCYSIAAATGIDKATLSRFMNAKGGLSGPNQDILAEHLGWTVAAKGRPQKQKGERA